MKKFFAAKLTAALLSGLIVCSASAALTADAAAPLGTPQITGLQITEDGILMKWNPVAGAKGYRLYYKNSAGEWRRFKDTAQTSYTDGGVAVGRTETYTIRTLDADGNPNSDYNPGGWSVVYKPLAPSVRSLRNTNEGIELSWNRIKGVGKYRVFFRNSAGNWSGLGNTTSTSFTDTKVQSGRSETYTVRGISDSGDFITPYNTTGWTTVYLGTPKITSARSVGNGVKISWNPVKGAYGYRVFYKNGKGGWSGMANVTSPSYVDKEVNSGSTYTYTVRCIDKNGSFTSGYDTTGVKGTYIAVPKITGLSSTENGVKISWSASKGAYGYRVFYKNSKGSWSGLANVTSTSFTDSDVKSGRSYTYTVRCIDRNGNFISDYDANGKSVTYTAAPDFTLKSKLGGVSIRWNKIDGAEKYRIFYLNKNGSWVKLADTENCSYLDKDVRNGGSYTYTVRCISADGKQYTSPFITAGKKIKYINPETGFTDKEKQAAAVAKEIISNIPADATDEEKIQYAASAAAHYSSQATYTSEGTDYATPYGVFVKGEYTCAGSTRALGLLLDYLGYDWKHANEGLWTHQWCIVYVNGEKAWADGQIGMCGYGEYPFAELRD